MEFLDNCDFETGRLNNNDLPTTETTETDLEMTTEEEGKVDLQELVYNSMTEKIPGVDTDVVLTGEIDGTTPGEGEEDPFFKTQKVILDYELNGDQDKIEPSHSDKSLRHEDHYDSDKSSPELDKNHSSNLRSNLNLLILILHSVFLFLCRNTALSI